MATHTLTLAWDNAEDPERLQRLLPQLGIPGTHSRLLLLLARASAQITPEPPSQPSDQPSFWMRLGHALYLRFAGAFFDSTPWDRLDSTERLYWSRAARDLVTRDLAAVLEAQ